MNDQQSVIKTETHKSNRATALYVSHVCFWVNTIVFLLITLLHDTQVPLMVMNGIYGVFIVNFLIGITAVGIMVKRKRNT